MSRRAATRDMLSAGQGSEFVTALEATSREIRDPVAKLRFIRMSLSRYHGLDRAVSRVPSALLRRALYRWLSLGGLRHMLNTNPLGAAPSLVTSSGQRALALNRALAVMVPLLAAGAAVSGYWRLSRAAPQAPAVVAAAPTPPARTEAAAVPAASIAPGGVQPSVVWLVEKGEHWEQYSNGLRIDTTQGVAGTRREYRTFDKSGRLEPELHTRPVGILFHTSESDVWPLEASFNENLRDSSQRLLRYVRRHRLYHYVIDRFGRVYRVVEEESKANHAGHSVWADEAKVYLNLNHAFLSISFETRWEGGQALPITQAQFAAGRTLAEYLRQRYAIPANMCVTHGLTSVNPRKHLIGHHMDWARGFPFEAFGLPDQYREVAPSVALFGFGYDEDFLKVLPQPWEGVRLAERALAREAAARGITVASLRQERQAAYDRWLSEQARDEETRAAGAAPAGGKLPLGASGESTSGQVGLRITRH